jgi:hypothetical protein
MGTIRGTFAISVKTPFQSLLSNLTKGDDLFLLKKFHKLNCAFPLLEEMFSVY